ncbi:MAG: tetratricopeptide repeat protein [Granulosicoccus sp.]
MPIANKLVFSTVVLAVLHSAPAAALNIHYDDTRAAELVKCDTHRYHGDEAAAQSCFQALQDDKRILVRADAAAALGEIRQANRLYRKATSDSRDPSIRTNWGNLYLETHQVSDAIALFREALVFDATYLPARLGLAEALSQTFEGKAREQLVDIVTNFPNSVKALLLLARIELELQNIPEARGLLNRALTAAKAIQVPPLEIYALLAGAELLEDNSMQVWADKALAYNPNYGDIFAIPAHFYIITYRYREAIELYRRAVKTSPELATAHRDLGINLLRVNDMFGARHYLQRAFELDPFDVQTVNTLRLLEDLDDMRISQFDVADPDNPGQLIGRAIVRLDREDADALEPYVLDLITRAMQTFSKRYDFQLQQPMIVELYHDHDDFGVRTVSTPGIGLLGVTFGYLTAMDSPKARPAGDFHWGSTLWHEIAHVYTLEATNHRLPRWLSEGLSVYEEWNTGPLADRGLPMDTLDALKSGRFLPIEELDSGFVRPSYQGQVNVSYMQAGLICDFIATRWGHPALVTLLNSFGAREPVSVAIKTAIELSPKEFDIEFNRYLISTYGDLLDSLDRYRSASRQLTQAVEMEDWVSVEALSRDLIRRYPARISANGPYEILAAAQREQGDTAGAIDTLLAWHERGGHQPVALKELAEVLREEGRDNDAASVMESLNWVSPYATEEHSLLGNHYLAQREPKLAQREFDALLGLQPEDPVEAHFGKARAALQLEDTVTARQQVLYALENAPFFRPAQRLLIELNAGDAID